jgi:hypothetical protein
MPRCCCCACISTSQHDVHGQNVCLSRAWHAQLHPATMKSAANSCPIKLSLAHLECAKLSLTARNNPAVLLVVDYAVSAAADACSGIGADCLQQDMSSAEQGSACTPLQEGAVCSTDGKHCRAGSCSDEGALSQCFEQWPSWQMLYGHLAYSPHCSATIGYSEAPKRSSLFQLCCSCTQVVPPLAMAWHADGCGVLM